MRIFFIIIGKNIISDHIYCDKSAEKFRMTGYELTGLAAQSCLEFIDADKPMKEDITIGTNTSIE